MPTKVLIIHFNAQQYRERLSKRFPMVEFHAVEHGEEAEPVIAGIDVIMGLGHHIPPALIAKAKALKWVQALTTGTETLKAARATSIPATREPITGMRSSNAKRIASRSA